MKTLVAITLALAAVAIAVLTYRAEPDTLDQRIKVEMEKSKPARPSPSVVLSINAAVPSPIPTPVTKPTLGPIAQEYAKARALKSLYDRLAAPGGATTPEAKYFLYKIAAGCLKRSDAKPGAPSKDLEARRRELEASIPAGSSDRQKRLALLDELAARCAGFESMTTTQAELDKLLADAAAAGDPKAQARLAAPQLQNAPGQQTHMTITDDQFHSLQAAIASRDPEAIFIAGTALSNTFSDAVMLVGADHEPVQNDASMEAWRLVACEYGMECGPDSPYVRSACALSGWCAALTVPDHVFYYSVAPFEAQLIDQYRQLFRNAVANNDWSAIQLSRQQNTTDRRYYFATGP
jgi:hypothetical protein